MIVDELDVSDMFPHALTIYQSERSPFFSLGMVFFVLSAWFFLGGESFAQVLSNQEVQVDMGVVDGLKSPHFNVRDMAGRMLWDQFTELGEEENGNDLQNSLVSSWLQLYWGTRDFETRLRLHRLIREGVKHCEYLNNQKGFLGIRFLSSQTLHHRHRRVVPTLVVQGVVAGSAAEAAGLLMQDHILAIGDFQVGKQQNPDDVVAFLSSQKPGKTLEVQLIRRGEEKKVKVTLKARPSEHQKQIPFSAFFDRWWDTQRP